MVYFFCFFCLGKGGSLPSTRIGYRIPDFVQLCPTEQGVSRQISGKVTLMTLGDLDPLTGSIRRLQEIHTEAFKSTSRGMKLQSVHTLDTFNHS
jgi:hypothetical protein